MAKMTVKLPEDLQRRLERAGREMDSIAEAGLKAGARALEREAETSLERALRLPRKTPKRGTGELQEALGITPMLITDRGQYDVKVGFREPRRKQPGKRIGRSKKGGGYYVATNAMVANILEHGHAGSRGGQAPAPWWKPVERPGRKTAEETMRRTVESRLDDIFNKE